MRSVYTARSDDFRTQGYGATKYAYIAASVRALALHAAGVPGVFVRETRRELYAPGSNPVGRGWRGETWPLDRTASAFDVLVPDDVDDQRLAVARLTPAINLAGRSRLSWALGGNAYVTFGTWPAAVGAPDPCAFAAPTPADRAILDRLPAMTLPPIHVPYVDPPPGPPHPDRGECPDGHGHAPRAFPTARSGRWARWYRCATCGRTFDRDGFAYGGK